MPLPAVLSIVTAPPDWRQKPCTCDRPSPVPLPTALVVKKGSNTRDRTSGLIPRPLSLTAITTKAPPSPSGARPASSCLFSAEIVTAPSFGMASRAFNTMLSSASSNSLLSTWTIPRSRARANCSRTCGPTVLRRIGSSSLIVEAASTVSGLSGWRREKLRSWRVSAAPRRLADSMASAAWLALRSEPTASLSRGM